MNYYLRQAFDFIFSSFVEKSYLFDGVYDRDYRRPEMILGLAKELKVFPRPEHCCLISGSKGKGTASRLLAWNLQSSGKKVGLILTPEEVCHLDRIRVDNQQIPISDFLRIVNFLRPFLEKKLLDVGGGGYLSPTGIFFLIGLVWFKEQAVDFCVIEGGRGVAYDEIGGVPAQVGLLTSILGEHLGRLGPSIVDVAKDKLSLLNNVELVVAPNEVVAFSCLVDSSLAGKIIYSADSDLSFEYPAWYRKIYGLVETALYVFLKKTAVCLPFGCPSFQFLKGGISAGVVVSGSICCDGVINKNSLDFDFLISTGLVKGVALVGLSDDKPVKEIIGGLQKCGFKDIFAVRLTSSIDHISSQWIEGSEFPVLCDLDVVAGGGESLSVQVVDLALTYNSVYAIGVQVFLRSLRQSFSIEYVHPRAVGLV